MKNPKIKSHTFYKDPGHGWLKVAKKDLVTLGIQDKISGFSYMRGEFAYLEEDSDLSIFLDALCGENQDLINEFRNKIKDSYSDKQSKVRSYENYHIITPEEHQEITELKSKVLAAKNWNIATIKRICNASIENLRYWHNEYVEKQKVII